MNLEFDYDKINERIEYLKIKRPLSKSETHELLMKLTWDYIHFWFKFESALQKSDLIYKMNHPQLCLPPHIK
jgi:hypothetical protein